MIYQSTNELGKEQLLDKIQELTKENKNLQETNKKIKDELQEQKTILIFLQSRCSYKGFILYLLENKLVQSYQQCSDFYRKKKNRS